MLDSGASNNFIHRDTAERLNLELVKNTRAVSLQVIDGRLLSPVEYETVLLNITIAGHEEWISFNVIQSPHAEVILGIPWLRKHNPDIDWCRGSMNFSNCSGKCCQIPVTAESNVEPEHLGKLAATQNPCDLVLAAQDEQLNVTRNIRPEDEQHNKHKPAKSLFAVPILRNINRSHDLVRWHHRLCHDGRPWTKEGMNILPTKIQHFCEDRAVAKAREQPFPTRAKEKYWHLLERINVDECGPLPTPSLDGERYFITFSEHASRMKFTFLLHQKNEALERFRDLKTRLENQTGQTVKILFGDNDNVFVNTKFMNYLVKNGIEWQSTVEYSSEQNGVSERDHLTLMDAARAMLVHARLPESFWGPAILTASHVHNVCPHPKDPNTTPHEVLRISKPDIRYLRTFGCEAYEFIPHELCKKLDPRARKEIFIGYANHQNGYILFHPDLGMSKVYRSVVFNEEGFGNRTAEDVLADTPEPENTFDLDYLPEQKMVQQAEIVEIDQENEEVCSSKRSRKPRLSLDIQFTTPD